METLHMCVKAMAKIMPKRISNPGTTLMSSVNGYLQQEVSWIIGVW